MLPRLSGVELARRIRASWPDTKIILMSGYVEHTLLDRLDEDLEVLQKPVTPRQLVGHIDELLA